MIQITSTNIQFLHIYMMILKNALENRDSREKVDQNYQISIRQLYIEGNYLKHIFRLQ